MRWLLACALVGLVSGAAALGCDSGECEEDAECTEVVCPDETRHTMCKADQTCYTIEDCPKDTGGGW